MLRSKIVAALLAAALAFSPVSVFAGITPPPLPVASSSRAAPIGVWLIFGCASGIILAAAIANSRDNRQLTASEAATCGLLFLFSPPRRR